MHCPRYHRPRMQLLQQVRETDIKKILSIPQTAKAMAKWFVKQGIMAQFKAAREIAGEDASQYAPFDDLTKW
jgi:hypothetical protein